MSTGITLGQFGTFDIGNYGDLLYPLLLDRMLKKRGMDAEVRKFSFMAARSTLGCGYDTLPILDLLSSKSLTRLNLIVGGGDLLRTDWDMLASHYRSAQSPHGGSALAAKWRRLVARLFSRRRRMDRLFRQRYMNYSAPGPFMIDPGNFPALAAVAYCSCGVPFAFADAEKEQVARAMNSAAFVHVRDRPSERKLREAGVEREIHVAPDLAVMLGEFFDADAGREKGRRILEANGVKPGRKILCVQSNPQVRDKHLALVDQLRLFQRRNGWNVVLLPLGRCHGDDIYLKQLAREAGNGVRCLALDSVFEALGVLAACDAFLGKSLHGNITAFSFGIPHLIGPIEVDKCQGFLDMVNLPPELKLQSWDEADARLDLVTGLGGKYFRRLATAARRQVDEVFDRMLQSLVDGRAATPG